MFHRSLPSDWNQDHASQAGIDGDAPGILSILFISRGGADILAVSVEKRSKAKGPQSSKVDIWSVQEKVALWFFGGEHREAARLKTKRQLRCRTLKVRLEVI